MDWRPKGDVGSATSRLGVVAPHHADAFNALFRIENTLRVFVYAVLKAKAGAGWTEYRVEVDLENGPQPRAPTANDSVAPQLPKQVAPTLGSVFKRAAENQRPFEYLGLAASCPMLFVTMRELVGIIETKRELFARYFPGGKIPKSLQELVALRNAFAHFRHFTPKHAERVKSIATDALGVVEDYVGSLVAVGETEAPPNSDASWYHEVLSVIAAPLTGRLFEHGITARRTLKPDDGRWVTLALDHDVRAIEMRRIVAPHGSNLEMHAYIVPNLRTPSVATVFPSLLADCVCLRETPLPRSGGMYARWDKDGECFRFGKRILLTFPLARMKERSNSITGEVAVLCSTILAECDALARDRRNRTSLVECEKVEEDWFEEDGEWAVVPPFDVEFFPCTAEHCVEYWDVTGPRRNFITHANAFPWIRTPRPDD